MLEEDCDFSRDIDNIKKTITQLIENKLSSII